MELSQEDLAAIEAGMVKRDVCGRRLEEIIDSEFGDNIGDGVTRLSRLLELNRLEIRIAVPKHGTGIYHEKIGIFFDLEQFVAFTGSSNESRHAFESNRECIDVYTSWDNSSRAYRKRSHFHELWEGTDKGVETYKFPAAAKAKLLQIVNHNHLRKNNAREKNRWRHQDEAVETFLREERGVLNMATGTGKTRTAIKIVRNLFESARVNTVIITMDGTDLLRQWRGELLGLVKQLPHPVRLLCDFEEYRDIQEFTLEPSDSILLVSRRPGKARDPLASSLRRLRSGDARKSILIHDEVHRLGSPINRTRLEGLSDKFRYRLGLSATPEREYDAEGNSFIEEHIGPVIMTFGLDDAISRGVLAPFNYFPLTYELTDEDHERLQSVYKMRSARAAAGDPMTNEELWIKLAHVYKTSPAKLPVFEDFIRANQSLLERCIIFTETQEYGFRVLDLLHKYRPDFHTYFTGENPDTLQRFARGSLECLVTCHRLSEGIDIRSLNTAVLFASSRTRLETIQRMGRCLRIDPDNPAKIAHVVDFVRSPEGGENNGEEERATADDLRKRWLTKLSDARAERGEDEHEPRS